MKQPDSISPFRRRLITAKTVFTVSLIVILLTILSVWLFGLGMHRTVFANSILSTSLLSLSFFLFLAVGLYNGIKLKDDMGKITDKIKLSKIPNLGELAPATDLLTVGDGLEGILLSIFLWIVMTILLLIFLWLFGAVLWSGILVFIAALYWIFFRALRLVFKNSNRCKGNLATSVGYAFSFTALYIFWVYVIIISTHYLIK